MIVTMSETPWRSATTVHSPNRHGASRRTVLRHQPRVVSSPSSARISWKVGSRFLRAVSMVTIVTASSVGSVLKNHPSRWVP
jgi:hypothetical protein